MRTGGAGRPAAAKAATNPRWVRSSARSMAGSPPTSSEVVLVVIDTGRCRPTATPRQSKPGPRLATVAGTRTSTPIAATGLKPDGLGHLDHMRPGLAGRRRTGDPPVGGLQPVAGEDADSNAALGEVSCR